MGDRHLLRGVAVDDQLSGERRDVDLLIVGARLDEDGVGGGGARVDGVDGSGDLIHRRRVRIVGRCLAPTPRNVSIPSNNPPQTWQRQSLQTGRSCGWLPAPWPQ